MYNCEGGRGGGKLKEQKKERSNDSDTGNIKSYRLIRAFEKTRRPRGRFSPFFFQKKLQLKCQSQKVSNCADWFFPLQFEIRIKNYIVYDKNEKPATQNSRKFVGVWGWSRDYNMKNSHREIHRSLRLQRARSTHSFSGFACTQHTHTHWFVIFFSFIIIASSHTYTLVHTTTIAQYNDSDQSCSNLISSPAYMLLIFSLS